MEHCLLHCPQWGAQRHELSDLIVQNDAQASMANMLNEVGKLARFVRKTGRLEFQKGGAQEAEEVVPGAKGLFLFVKFRCWTGV